MDLNQNSLNLHNTCPLCGTVLAIGTSNAEIRSEKWNRRLPFSNWKISFTFPLRIKCIRLLIWIKDKTRSVTILKKHTKNIKDARSWWDLDPRPKVYKTFALTRLSYMTSENILSTSNVY